MHVCADRARAPVPVHDGVKLVVLAEDDAVEVLNHLPPALDVTPARVRVQGQHGMRPRAGGEALHVVFAEVAVSPPGGVGVAGAPGVEGAVAGGAGEVAVVHLVRARRQHAAPEGVHHRLDTDDGTEGRGGRQATGRE